MAKLSDDVESFKTGDIIITQRTEAARVFHTTMFLEARHSPLGVRSFVHAGSDVTEVRPATDYQNYTPPPHRRYTCPSAPVGVAVAEQAVSWAAVGRTTPYGDGPSSRTVAIGGGTNSNRYSGMVTTAALTDIPFEISALMRVLKWVDRANSNRSLSVTRGITCCAFICASFQTAFMKKYLDGNFVSAQKLREALAALTRELETKATVRARTNLAPLETNADKGDLPKGTKIGFVGQALRANSNRLVKDGSVLSDFASLDEQWQYIQTAYLGMKADAVHIRPLKDIIPKLVRYDVKYLNTKLFETALTNNNWGHKHYEQY